MFGLGFFEIILILIGILIFIRPQDLPAFVYRVGKIYGQIKEAYNKFYREINIIKNQMDEMVEKQKLNEEKKNETLSSPQSPTPLQEIMPFTRPKPKIEKKSIKKSKTQSARSPASKKGTRRKTTPSGSKPKSAISQKKTRSSKVEKSNSQTTGVKSSPRGQKSKPRSKNTSSK